MLIIAASYLFKRGFYDKLIPISDAMSFIERQKFSKVIVGTFFMLCYLKNPSAGMSYCFSNKQLVSEAFLARQLESSKTTYSSPIINESVVIYGVVIGLYSFLIYKLFLGM